MKQLAENIVQAAKDRNLVIATAESCTAGLLSAALTEIPGASDMFDRGFVTYSNISKQEMLGVLVKSLDRFGAVSKTIATEMAAGAIKNSYADIAVSITGIAGPGGSEHKPEGRVCFACLSTKTKVVQSIDFGVLGRQNLRMKAVEHALSMLLDAIQAHNLIKK